MATETTEARAERIVRQEVYVCLSSLVSTLASGYGSIYEANHKGSHLNNLAELSEQAYELASSVLDYEEAASQDGWKGPFTDKFGATYFTNETESEQNTTWAAPSWEALCRDFDIDAYEWEVFEHWSVSEWLGRKLQGVGEKVDFDFAGMVVWARQTTGQGISQDGCIRSVIALADKESADL